LFIPLIICAKPFSVAVPLTVPILNVVPLNVASPVIIPLFEAPSVNTTVRPEIVVEFEEVSVNVRLVIVELSPPLIAPVTVPPQIILFESVCTPLVAVLKYASPVIVPVLYEVSRKVALPTILVVFTVLLANITPVVFVRPVESIKDGNVVVEVLIIGEVVPTSTASFIVPGRDPIFTEQAFEVYQLLTLFQFESTVPHQ